MQGCDRMASKRLIDVTAGNITFVIIDIYIYKVYP